MKRFCLFLTIFINTLFNASGVKIQDGKACIEASDIDNGTLFAVHVRAEPFGERTLIPGNKLLGKEGEYQLTDYSKLFAQGRETMHFCVGNMVPELPDEDEVEDGDMQKKWEDFAKYAVLIPITEDFLSRAKTSSLDDLFIAGAFQLPETTISLYPSGEGAVPTWSGQHVPYDASKQNIRQAIEACLQEKNAVIFNYSYESEDDFFASSFYQGVRVEGSSLFSAAKLESPQAIAHSESSFYFTEVLPKVVNIFHDVMLYDFDHYRYLGAFLEYLLIERTLDQTLVDNYYTEKEMSQRLIASEENNCFIRERCGSYKKFRKIWEIEKDLVTKDKKSALLSPQWVELMLSDVKKEELSSKLSSIAVPFDLEEKFSSCTMELSPAFLGDDDSQIKTYSVNLHVSEREEPIGIFENHLNWIFESHDLNPDKVTPFLKKFLNSGRKSSVEEAFNSVVAEFGIKASRPE